MKDAKWLVTGGSRGIGAAIARRSLAGGASVAVVSRHRADAVVDAADRHFAIEADLAEPDAPARVVAAAVDALGGLDVVVNNAAVHRGGRIERLDEGAFEEVVELDLIVPFRLCRAAVPHLGEGSAIVNVGAVVGQRGFSGDSPYASAKAGLTGLTMVLAVELARRGITANVVVPGFTETEMTDGIDARSRQRIIDRIPLGRAARPEEIADAVWWVANSSYMTGAVVPVDGGLMAGFGGR